MIYCLNFREKGLSEVCDLIEEAKDARMDEEKSEVRRNFLRKIPECLVNIKLYRTLSQIPSMLCFLGLF